MNSDYQHEILRRLHSLRHRKGKLLPFNPHLHWKIIVIVFVIGVVFVGLGEGYIFFEVKRGEESAPAPAREIVESIDETKLKQIIETFELKEQKLHRLQLEKPAHIDPS